MTIRWKAYDKKPFNWLTNINTVTKEMFTRRNVRMSYTLIPHVATLKLMKGH